MKDKELNPVVKFHKQQKKKASLEKKQEKQKKKTLGDARQNPEKYIEKYNQISGKSSLSKQQKTRKSELESVVQVAKKEIEKREKIAQRVENSKSSIDEEKRYEELNRELIQQQEMQNYLKNKEMYDFYSNPPVNADKSGPVIIDNVPLPIGPKFIIRQEKPEYIEISGHDYYEEDFEE